MFSLLALRERKRAGGAQPSRLASAAASCSAIGQAAAATADAHARHEAPNCLEVQAASCASPYVQQHAEELVARPHALPALHMRLDRRVGAAATRRRHLPHVLPADASSAAHTSLEGLQRKAELFKGKHSTVCTYLDSRSGAVVAIKTYYKKTMAKRHFRNVRREVAISRLLARQRFTGAVQLLGAFEDDDHIFLVQEHCSGGDLYRRLVKAGGLLPEAEVCRDVVVPLLLTLTFLHANHIVHRDIKPENVFFSADGGLRLGDFGLSIDARQERPTSRVGTLDYMAPEVVGMPSPDDIQRRGLAPHQVGHYGCKVDVWAVGILTFELICGRPPFEVEDMKQTEAHIQFSEVSFPPHMSPACRSFIQQALTKRPESRPSAAQLFRHPWVQETYQSVLTDFVNTPRAATAAAAAAAAVAGSHLHTPELRRTASQPPSPSKSMPGEAAGRAGGGGAATPAAVAAALAPFLPLSQAKMAHKVRLLSPGRPASARAARPRRRVSDPLGRHGAAAAAHVGVAATTAGAAAAAVAPDAAAGEESLPIGPPTTPLAQQCAVSDGAGAVAGAAVDAADEFDSTIAPAFETPGTPGLKTTPLPRQRPMPPAQQRGLLSRTPFLMPLLQLGSPAGSTPAAAAEGAPGPRSRGGAAGAGAPSQRSRFAAEAENDEAAASCRSSAGGGSLLGSPGVVAGRSASFTAFATSAGSGKDKSGGFGNSDSLELAARSNSFASFGGNSSGNLQLAARAGSFSSFGGSSGNLGGTGSSGNLPGLGVGRAGSCSPVGKAGRGKQQQQQQDGAQEGGAAGEGAAAMAERLQRLQLA